MSDEEKDPIESYVVLVNDEEQHSLWPAHKSVPAGWRNVGFYGSKAECLEYIEKSWTDITPLSVRQRLAASRNVQS